MRDAPSEIVQLWLCVIVDSITAKPESPRRFTSAQPLNVYRSPHLHVRLDAFHP
jgi:hypothetical protein